MQCGKPAQFVSQIGGTNKQTKDGNRILVKQLFGHLAFHYQSLPLDKQIKLIWFVGPQKPLPKCPSSSSYLSV